MKLCVSLDMPTFSENIALVEKLSQRPLWYKVGFRSFIRDGKAILEEIKTIQCQNKIFLDLKLYDIPNTMADAAETIAGLGVDMFNVHASSGHHAMQCVMERLNTFETRPLVLAVTALTSFDEGSFTKIYNQTIARKALEFAKDAASSGIDGVVCSVFESALIKAETDKDFLTLCPGIRPFNESSDDQKRVADLEKAYNENVNFAVIGRPVYKAVNPVEVVERIVNSGFVE